MGVRGEGAVGRERDSPQAPYNHYVYLVACAVALRGHECSSVAVEDE